MPPGDKRAGQPSRDGEEQPETVACFALPAFLFGVVRVVRVHSYGPRPKHLEQSWLWDGVQGRVPARRVGTLRHSPGVPTPDPDPFGHGRGSGGVPPDGRLGRPLGQAERGTR